MSAVSPYDLHEWPLTETVEPLRLRSFPASNLADRPIPARPWLVNEFVPGKQVTLLFGDGAAGKSLLALQLALAVATGKDWVGLNAERGPAIYVGAEDDEDEIHRRLADIAKAKNVGLHELTNLHIVPLAGLDAVIAEPDGRNSDRLRPTRVWQAVADLAGLIQPRLLIVDTLADAFAGNENSRPQARQFISLLRGLAIERDLAIVVLAHPSIAGMSQGTGTSGSTGWNNSVRSRLYFERVTVDKIEPDPDIRVLTVKKVNYGKVGKGLRLRWVRGSFEPEQAPASFERIASDARADHVFIRILGRLTAQKRYVSHKRSPSFAPTVFAKQPDAEGCTKAMLEAAMDRLFDASRIHVEEHGPPSARTSKIVLSAVLSGANGLGTVCLNGLGTGAGNGSEPA